MNATEFGRHHGKSDTAVRKQAKKGNLKRFDDGSFDPDL
jgi:hypothetical protein